MPGETDALSASLQDLALSLNTHSSLLSLSDAPDSSAREARLSQELEQIRTVNMTITAVLDSMTQAESNLDKVVTTTKNVDSLLNLWIRILSQTEHTQRILFDSKWEGVTRDDQLYQQRLAVIAEQQIQAQAQAQRRAQEIDMATQRRKEAEEQSRMRNAMMQKRIYGNKVPKKTASTVAAKTASPPAVPARQRSVLRNTSNTTSASRIAGGGLSGTATGK